MEDDKASDSTPVATEDDEANSSSASVTREEDYIVSKTLVAMEVDDKFGPVSMDMKDNVVRGTSVAMKDDDANGIQQVTLSICLYSLIQIQIPGRASKLMHHLLSVPQVWITFPMMNIHHLRSPNMNVRSFAVLVTYAMIRFPNTNTGWIVAATSTTVISSHSSMGCKGLVYLPPSVPILCYFHFHNRWWC